MLSFSYYLSHYDSPLSSLSIFHHCHLPSIFSLLRCRSYSRWRLSLAHARMVPLRRELTRKWCACEHWLTQCGLVGMLAFPYGSVARPWICGLSMKLDSSFWAAWANGNAANKIPSWWLTLFQLTFSRPCSWLVILPPSFMRLLLHYLSFVVVTFHWSYPLFSCFDLSSLSLKRCKRVVVSMLLWFLICHFPRALPLRKSTHLLSLFTASFSCRCWQGMPSFFCTKSQSRLLVCSILACSIWCDCADIVLLSE